MSGSIHKAGARSVRGGAQGVYRAGKRIIGMSPALHGGSVVPPALLALSSRWVAEGDSITAGSNDAQWSWNAIARTAGRFFNPQNWNQAVGGQTAAQMATQIAATMGPLPKIVTFLAGTNDVSGTSDPPATIYGNIRTCVKGYLDGGAAYVIVSRVLPRNDTAFTALTPARQGDLTTLNGMIANLPTDPALAAYAGRVKLATDITSTLILASETVDGLHPNWKGANRLGQSFADAMNTCIVTTSKLNDLYLDASNLAPNPALTGTAGGKSGTGPVTGNVADIWNVQENGGMAVACSKTTLNGAAAQEVVVSGTNSTTGRVVNFSVGVNVTGNVGDAIEACVDFQIAAGYQNLRSIVVNCATSSTPNSSAPTVMDGGGALSGTLRSAIDTPLTAGITNTSLQAYLMFAAGAVAADIIWGRPYIRKVPTTQ